LAKEIKSPILGSIKVRRPIKNIMTKQEFITSLKTFSAHSLAKGIASSIYNKEDDETSHRQLMIGELRSRLGSGELALAAARKELVTLIEEGK